jgi:hypothetical protein
MRASSVLEPALEDLPLVLTVEEAARVLRIGRSLGYQLARRYLAAGGAEGLPVMRLGSACLRVPRWALIELVGTGRVVRCNDTGAMLSGRAGDGR